MGELRVLGAMKFKIRSPEEVAAREIVTRHYLHQGCKCASITLDPMQEGKNEGEGFCIAKVRLEKEGRREERLKVLFKFGKVHGVTHAT